MEHNSRLDVDLGCFGEAVPRLTFQSAPIEFINDTSPCLPSLSTLGSIRSRRRSCPIPHLTPRETAVRFSRITVGFCCLALRSIIASTFQPLERFGDWNATTNDRVFHHHLSCKRGLGEPPSDDATLVDGANFISTRSMTGPDPALGALKSRTIGGFSNSVLHERA